MELIIKILEILDDHYGVITSISVIIAGFWAIIKFREHVKDKRFKTYHELIDELVNEQRHPDRTIKLDRQIAVVFELRNFPRYYNVTKRILTGLKNSTWKNGDQRILEEIKLTLEYIERSVFLRIFKK